MSTHVDVGGRCLAGQGRSASTVVHRSVRDVRMCVTGGVGGGASGWLPETGLMMTVTRLSERVLDLMEQTKSQNSEGQKAREYSGLVVHLEWGSEYMKI